MIKSIKFAFTLVELIVTITILAILGTIAFISLQGYSQDARNSVRISDISNIDKALGVKIVESGKVPIPDDYIQVTASGTLVNYQGVAGKKVLDVLGIFNGGKDPKDDTYYTYSTNGDLTKYQIIGFLEGDILGYGNLVSFSYAESDLSQRQIITKGSELGILLDEITNNPKQLDGLDIDVLNDENNYKSIFSQDIDVSGTGEVLYSYFYNRNKNLLKDDVFAKLDDDLILYFDMETLTSSGGIDVLKDLSKYGNNAECYNNGILVSCGGVNGPKFVDGGMEFDGINDLLKIGKNSLFDLNDFTIVTSIKHSGAQEANYGGGWRIVSSQLSDFYFLRINDSYEQDGVTPHDRGSIAFGVYSFGVRSGIGKYSKYSDIFDLEKHSLIAQKGDKLLTYQDGTLINQTTNSTGLIPCPNDIYIGGYGNLVESFSGEIYEVRIYNRALSEYEVKILNDVLK